MVEVKSEESQRDAITITNNTPGSIFNGTTNRSQVSTKLFVVSEGNLGCSSKARYSSNVLKNINIFSNRCRSISAIKVGQIYSSSVTSLRC